MKKTLLPVLALLASGLCAAQDMGRVLSSTPLTQDDAIVGYQVVYEYAGKQYQAQLPNDPGSYLPLQIAPAAPTAAPSGPAAPAYAQTPPGYAPPAYVQPAPVIVQQVVIPTYPAYATYPAYPYYAQPYYYPPVGISLGIGFGYRGGHRHRHRR